MYETHLAKLQNLMGRGSRALTQDGGSATQPRVGNVTRALRAMTVMIVPPVAALDGPSVLFGMVVIRGSARLGKGRPLA